MGEHALRYELQMIGVCYSSTVKRQGVACYLLYGVDETTKLS
jgi:hypothetical protein